ncbi:MAG: hypothetical protein WC890_02210 [Candidatus Margulisiibacteriota bacterium]
MKKSPIVLGLSFSVILILVSFLLFLAHGCGQSGGGTPTTNYSIQGNISVLSAGSIHSQSILDVTHIVAIGSNNSKYLATLNSDGSFVINIVKGVPYALGFYNKSNGVITLLGYLKQNEVNWDSLPIMNPTGEVTDLGSVEVNQASVEATASIDLSSLISQFSMVDLATAQLYGQIDNPMTVFTNVDIDGNGEFDFQEGKSYLFSAYINVVATGETGTDQISHMLNGNYNELYKPLPEAYGFNFAGSGDNLSNGSRIDAAFPTLVYDSYGDSHSGATGEVSNTGGSNPWTCFLTIGSSPIYLPTVAPFGTYLLTCEAKTYTINNFSGATAMAVGNNNDIIYPIFNLVTNEAGFITTVNYQWRKLVNGVISTPTAAEIKAVVEDTSLDNGFVHTSPFISFFSGPSTLIGTVYKFSRDGNSLDVSSYNVRFSEIHHIQASYNLTSRVVCKFELY